MLAQIPLALPYSDDLEVIPDDEGRAHLACLGSQTTISGQSVLSSPKKALRNR